MYPKAAKKTVTVLGKRKWFTATYAPKKPDSKKPAIVLIHGRTSEHFSTWKNQISHFTQKGYRVVAYDLDGHGNSQGDGKLTIQQHARGLKELIEKAGIREAVLIGHSDGGVIAQQFAHDHPEYVLGVGLVNSYVSLSEEMKTTIRGIMDAYQKESSEWDHVTYPETRRRLLELGQYAGFPLPNLSKGYNPLTLLKMKKYFNMLRNHSDVFNEAQAPRIPPIFPLKIINAEHDFFLSRKPQSDFTDRYGNRGAAPVMLDAKTHSLQLDLPTDVNRELDGLLREVKAMKKLDAAKQQAQATPPEGFWNRLVRTIRRPKT